MKNKYAKDDTQTEKLPFKKDQNVQPEEIDQELNQQDVRKGADWDSEAAGPDVKRQLDKDALIDDDTIDSDDEDEAQ